MLGLLALPASGGDARLEVRSVETRLVEGVYRLDAEVVVDLSRSIKRALDSGVPITLLYRIRVLRERAYLWGERVAALSQRYRLEFHALSKRYVLVNVNTGDGQAFRTLADAIAPLQRLRDFPLIDASLLAAGEHYAGEMEVLIDGESLPVPLRLQTWFNDAWRLASDTYRWPLTP
jgi:hypothetical protein